jgi:hypothetical protein
MYSYVRRGEVHWLGNGVPGRHLSETDLKKYPAHSACVFAPREKHYQDTVSNWRTARVSYGTSAYFVRDTMPRRASRHARFVPNLRFEFVSERRRRRPVLWNAGTTIPVPAPGNARLRLRDPEQLPIGGSPTPPTRAAHEDGEPTCALYRS